MNDLAVVILGPERLGEVTSFYSRALDSVGRFPLYPGVDDSPHTTVLGAVDTNSGKLAGTISFTGDGAAGVHTDAVFPEETDAVRAEGRRLFSAWRIATSEEYRDRGVAMLMIREVVSRLARSGMETTLMIFPPEDTQAYRVILGARVLKERVVTTEDRSATAVLMRVDIETLRCHRKFRDLL